MMNTAYGPASRMIFDVLHRRWPIEFSIRDHEVGRIAEVQEGLSTRIEQWIRGAMKSELATAKEAIKSLDHTCFTIMRREGEKERFCWPATDRMPVFAYEEQKQAIFRLIDLRLLEASFEPTEYFSAYQWTYLGKVVMNELRPLMQKLRELEVAAQSNCSHCSGKGTSSERCHDCRGAGYFTGVQCTKCNGAGETMKKCEYCGGTGRKPSAEAATQRSVRAPGTTGDAKP